MGPRPFSINHSDSSDSLSLSVSLSHTHTHTHTHTHIEGRVKTDYSGVGEGLTNRPAREHFDTFCHHVVTKRAGVTKHAGNASRLTRFVTKLGHLRTPRWGRQSHNGRPRRKEDSPRSFNSFDRLQRILCCSVMLWLCSVSTLDDGIFRNEVHVVFLWDIFHIAVNLRPVRSRGFNWRHSQIIRILTADLTTTYRDYPFNFVNSRWLNRPTLNHFMGLNAKSKKKKDDQKQNKNQLYSTTKYDAIFTTPVVFSTLR